MSATAAPIVLLSAPAGYGKTTLLALWRERDERPFAWLSLDAGDNDPVALIAGLLATLEPVLELRGEALGEDLDAPPEALEDVVLPAIVDACIERRRPFVLVLDDVHLVTERRCIEVIGYLAERLPAGCQLAVGTRTDPALPVAGWRAHGRLVDLRAAELSLGHAEARAVLAAAGVHLPDDQLAQLMERTEGWAAGLYLAALSLCDALTLRSDADAMLRELERSNLFVVPLDEDRVAYRYHHLFAQYLRAELARREPDLVPELHRRAWRWYREHGLVGRAVEHAQAAGDVEVAAELVSAAWSDLVRDGESETVRSWIDRFDDAEIEGHPPLAIAAAWTAALGGYPERAAHFTAAAGRGSWVGPMPDGTASLESAIAVTSAAFGVNGVSHMRELAQRAVDLEPAPNRFRGISLEILGAALTLQEDFERARGVLAEAIELAGEASSPGAFCLSQLAVIGLREGDADSAAHHAQRAHAVVQLPRMRFNLANVATFSVLARLLSRQGDREGAARAIEQADRLLPRLTGGFWWLMIETRILLAPALHALGRAEEAVTRLQEADALLAAHPDAGRLPEWHAKATRGLPRLGAGRARPRPRAQGLGLPAPRPPRPAA